MKILLLQVFVMLLAAYLLGAVVACVFRRGVIGKGDRQALQAGQSASRRV